ncbi:hypothetical protein SAMN06295905_3220 [Devosia lucknowensis]|uniref:Uncharacterized protein n=1 Tax=Devosia lucknowensis TaxID=1096929 RepID=A0A1Y6G720_9HYPH|nr:hypothetical protein [Devosia lucknowensis]SMQ85925.1 hypothetical protein SAMN06295905_3220 [Devosia lucknowensis]
MRTILRSDIQTCLDKLDPIRRYDLVQLEAEIFNLFDDRELRKLPCLMERFLEDKTPPDPSGLYDGLAALEAQVYERWAIVDPYIYVDNDYRDEAPPEAFKCLLGYFDAEGVFIPKPSLSPLPRYCHSTDDASHLRITVVGYHLLLALSERQTDTMDYEFEARLHSVTGETISDYVSTDAPIAVVGATLTALAKGWSHPLGGYVVKDA